jgi:hypothetical protein
MWSGRLVMPRYVIFWALLTLTCGYALWRGRKYEQLAALVCIAASVTSVLTRSPVHLRYSGVELGDLIIDTFVLLSFVAIALRSDRFWPLWVAGLQLTLSMSHLFKAIEPDLLPRAYAAAERFWSYPTLMIIAVAAWRQHRRGLAEDPPPQPAPA